MADRQGLLLKLIRLYESASKEERIAITAAVVHKCRESAAPVPARLKRVYINHDGFKSDGVLLSEPLESMFG